MDWKSVEMQVALPRTHNAGKTQNLLQQQSQLSQDHLAASAQTEQMRKRTTVEENEKHERTRFKKQGDRNSGKGRDSSKERQEEKKEQDPHPFKGKRIDYSG